MVLGGLVADPHDLGSLPQREPTEVAQLHDLSLALAERAESAECLVQPEDVDRVQSRLGARCDRGQLKPAGPRPRPPRTCMVDQNTPHGARGDRDELPTAALTQTLGTNQAGERLVDQRRRLQRVVFAFTPHLPSGDRPQLRVDKRHESSDRVRVACEVRAQMLGGCRLGSGHDSTIADTAGPCSFERTFVPGGVELAGRRRNATLRG